MKKSLVFLFFYSSCASSVSSEKIEIFNTCIKDSDCILFADGCRNLQAVSKTSLPEDHSSFEFDKIKVYTLNPSKFGCMSNLLVHPQWPDNPTPKCIKNECKVRSSIDNNKKR